MAGESVRKQAAANRAAAEQDELKAAILQALRDPDFRRAFWHELAIDARTAQARRNAVETGQTARNVESARTLKAIRAGRPGG